jgi:hypothetical protein
MISSSASTENLSAGSQPMPKGRSTQVSAILELIRAGWTPRKVLWFVVASLLAVWAGVEVWFRL